MSKAFNIWAETAGGGIILAAGDVAEGDFNKAYQSVSDEIAYGGGYHLVAIHEVTEA